VNQGGSKHGAAIAPQARWMAGFTFAAVEFVAMPIVDRVSPPSTAAGAGHGATLASGRRGTAAVLVMTSWPSLARGGGGCGGAAGGLASLVDNRVQGDRGCGAK
jgi:hypothetical protein